MGCSGSKNKVAASNLNSRTLKASKSLRKILTEERLDQYEDALVNQLGVTTGDDLALIADSDLQDLGMKPIEQRRFSKVRKSRLNKKPTVVPPASEETKEEAKEANNAISKAPAVGTAVGTAAGAAAVTSLEAIYTAESVVEVVQTEL